MSKNRNIRQDIRLMVESAYQILIELSDISTYFDDGMDVTNDEIVKFIDDIPEKVIEKWHRKIAKKTENDFLTNSESYMFDDGVLTWSDQEVYAWHREFYISKLVKRYRKTNNLVEPITISIVDSELEMFLSRKETNDYNEEEMIDMFLNRYNDIDTEYPIEAQLEQILFAQKQYFTYYMPI